MWNKYGSNENIVTHSTKKVHDSHRERVETFWLKF